ncbi:MAG: hypothetical protein ACPK85_10445 [Methanosarcina sp.]
MSIFGWLIIGRRSKNSNMPAFQPEWRWVDELQTQAKKARLKIYFKPNLEVRPEQYPCRIGAGIELSSFLSRGHAEF